MQVLPSLNSGGVERGVVDIANFIADSGHKSLVLSSKGKLKSALRNDVEFITLDVSSKNPFKIFSNISKIREIIKSHKIDILHVRSRAPAWSCYFAVKQTDCLLVSTFHGTYSLGLRKKSKSFLKKLYNSIMLKSSRVIAVSNFIKDHIKVNYPKHFSQAKTTVVHRGVDVNYFDATRVLDGAKVNLINKWRIPEDKKVIMLPARGTKWKGHEFLIDSLALLKRDDYICLFVGDFADKSNYKKSLEKKISNLGLESKIMFVGPTSDMAAAYFICDLVISASTSPEAFGRIAIEAQAMEKVVVATNIGGSKETVIDKKTGFLVNCGDIVAMSERIEDVLSMSHREYQEMAINARKHVVKNFSNDLMYDRTMDVYQSLVQNSLKNEQHGGLADLKNNLKKVHFIGIGGIGMSALAKILNSVNIKVQGSDIKKGNNIANLEKSGIDCFIGHDAKNISDDIDLVVITSIIRNNNPELVAAKAKNIKVIFRADMLAQIMSYQKGITIAGTHGKTSTTAMVATMLDIAKKDPTVVNGGIMNYYQSNYKIGNGDYIIAESDESDASFVRLPSFIGVINNIEPEHLDFYGGSFDKAKEYYLKYAKQIDPNGLLAIGIDDMEAHKMYKKLKQQKNIITFATDKEADIMANNIDFDTKGTTFDVKMPDGRLIEKLFLPLYGKHNVLNSLVALAIANHFNIAESVIREAFKNFLGVKKRFTKTGQVNGFSIIDDYAHHPTEIKFTLKAARNLAQDKKVIAVFQPHKHSRVQDLFDEFCNSFADADIVIVADIFKVGHVIEGVNKESLASGITKLGNKDVVILEDKSKLPHIIKSNAKEGDIIVCLGAGDITNWAHELPDLLTN